MGNEVDMGSIVLTKNINGIKEYVMLSKDLSRLQSDVIDCNTGSTVICVDTSEVYMFHSDTKTWYKL